ncbi:NAT_SF domain containing protein [uncultured Caudovirales phage]|uniref:NAT_SF domain containing protein n=1 Tax=uncultured Caudovirales phage TaxID=2100421 RepID=A0A6J5P1M6_9CAUD|nr:NAT_SF domain containing protein [uncultured Caudovirales phage]
MIRIRAADATDARTIHKLQRKTLPKDVPLAFEGPRWWIAYDNDKPVAYAALSNAEEPNAGYLSRSGVLKTHRGLGLQKRLIRVRLRAAKRLGMKVVVSDAVKGNGPSCNSLIACGFRVFAPAKPWGLDRSVYWRRRLDN